MVKLADIAETAAYAWSHDTLPKVVTGTLAGVMDDTFSSDSQLSIYEPFAGTDNSLNGKKNLTPVKSFTAPGKFSSIDWNSNNIIACGLEDSTIQLYDAGKLLDANVSDLIDARISEYKKHTTSVLQVQFNSLQPTILASSGSKGEIFIWDTVKNTSFSPGQAISPMNKVSSLDWNNSVSHIFGTAGDSGYASIWDLKVKREVLQLNYNNLNLSAINWHPSQSTKLVTATDNDSEPLIMTWDLRNSSVPETIMKGHKKGILSLDWCQNDANLLLSSGRDDSVYLWNPIKGDLLATYPTSPNSINQTRFAPKVPEVFAASSLSKKLSIQTIQDTSAPTTNTVKTENESDFWNQISTTETQKPSIKIKQAPLWLCRPISANFGYGGKLSIAHGKNVKVVNISSKNESLNKSAKQMIDAISTNNFSQLIESKKLAPVSSIDSKDWELLGKQVNKSSIEDLLDLPAESSTTESSEVDNDSNINEAEDDDDFFAQITKTKKMESVYVPSGEFSLVSNDDDFEKKAIDLLLSDNTEELIDLCIENDHINEALIISMNKSVELQEKAKNAYFKKYSSTNAFSRLLYSSSKKSISDIVKNADIDSWTLIAKSIIKFSKDHASFNVEMRLLGDRLINSELENSREHALSCYIASNSLEKVSGIWLSELEKYEKKYLTESNDDGSKNTEFEARFKALGDVIEKIVIFQSSSTTNLSTTDPSELSKLGKIFIEYADCLVNFGHYELAYKLLNMISDSISEVQIEKNRISKAFISSVAQTQSVNTTQNKRQNSKYGVPQQQQPMPTPVQTPFQNQTLPFQQQSQQLPGQSFSPVSANIDVTKQRTEKKRNPYVIPQSVTQAAPSISQPPAANPYAAPPAANPYAAPPAANPYAAPPVANPYAAPPAANPYAAPNSPAAPFVNNNGGMNNATTANPYAPKTALDSLKSPSLTNGTLNPYTASSAPPAGSFMTPSSVNKDVGGWNDLPQHLAPVIKPTTTPTPKQYQQHSTSRSISQALPIPAPPSVNKNSISNSPTPPPQPPFGAKQHNGVKNPYAPKPETYQSPMIPVAQSPLTRLPASDFNPAGPIAPPVMKHHAPPQAAASNLATPPPPANKNPYAPKTQPVQSTQQYAAPPQAMQQQGFQQQGFQQQGFQQQGFQPMNAQVPPPPPSMMKSTPPPPPQATSSLPPPQATSSLPPPPPQHQQQQQPPVESIVPETEFTSTTGDQSQYASIITILKAELEAVKPKVPEKFQKHMIDAEKRINILFNHLNAGDLLTSETITKLNALCESLKNNDLETAKTIRDDITMNHSAECGSWMVGVNRLIGTVEATSK